MLPSEEVAFHKPLLFSRQPVDQKSSHASTRYLHTFSQVSYFFDNRVLSGSSLPPIPSQETREAFHQLKPLATWVASHGCWGHIITRLWKWRKSQLTFVPWLSKWLTAGSETELVDLVMPEGFDIGSHLTASQSGDIEINPNMEPLQCLCSWCLRWGVILFYFFAGHKICSDLVQHRHLGFWLRPDKTCTKSSQSDGVHVWDGSISSVCSVEGTRGPAASKAALRLLVSLNRAEQQHSGTGRSSDPQRRERRAHTARDL